MSYFRGHTVALTDDFIDQKIKNTNCVNEGWQFPINITIKHWTLKYLLLKVFEKLRYN